MNKKLKYTILVGMLATSTIITPIMAMNTTSVLVVPQDEKQLVISNMPSYLKDSIEWVYQQRILKENALARQNLIFDQIVAGKGTLNYVVRWQSNQRISLSTRKNIEEMIGRQINNWTKHLVGYDNWPYREVKVKVVGWAVADESLIVDKQADEIVYTTYTNDVLHNDNAAIPINLPEAPTEISRFEHFTDKNYVYPGGLDKRFDMYLWGTSNFAGGAGGDWGQRISDEYILTAVNMDEAHIIEHEIGHGFGITDFYGEDERPPMGFPTPTIMWAGDSSVITEWDIWMLRYLWSVLKQDTTRFPVSIYEDVNNEGNSNSGDNNNTGNNANQDIIDNNIADLATIATSYCSPWETTTALNDRNTPSHSNDKSKGAYGNWPETGTQWVQYTFSKKYSITETSIYWFKDNQGIDVPLSYKIQYLDDSNNWVDVMNPKGLTTTINQFNKTTFAPVVTTGIRVVMISNSNYSTGILEWQVAGVETKEENGTDTSNPGENGEIEDSKGDNQELIDGEVEVTLKNSASTTTSTITPQIIIKGKEKSNYDISKIAIRYYFTADGLIQQNVWVDTAAINFNREPWYVPVNSGITATVKKMITPTETADHYMEITFDTKAILDQSAMIQLEARIAKEDWSQYNQINDYSYNNSNHVVILYNNSIISGSIPQ